MADATLLKSIVYPGYSNVASTPVFAARIRIIPRYNGTPAANNVVWSLGSGGAASFSMELTHLTATGLLQIRSQAVSGSATNINSSAAFVPVSGTPVDIMCSWDGTTAAGTFKFSIDGVELGTGTLNANHTAYSNNLLRSAITIGQGAGGVVSNFDLNEFVLYDTAENHVHTARTAFETPPSVGELFPIAAQVTSSYVFYYTNAQRTGTAAIPAVSSVVSGVAVNNTTGTYVTCATTDVKTAVLFGPLSSLTGSYTPASVTVSLAGAVRGLGSSQIY